MQIGVDMARFHTSIVSLLLSLAMFGCSSDGPTGHDNTERLPATPITVMPVIRASSSLEGFKGSDSVAGISFAAVPWFDSVDYGDVHVRFEMVWGRPRFGVFILDPALNSWRELEGAITVEPGGCFGYGPCYVSGNRLLSQTFGSLPGDIVDNSGTLRIAGDGVWKFKARLVQYDPTYTFKTLVSSWPKTSFDDAATILRDTLWYMLTFEDIVTGLMVDSLLAFSMAGERLMGYGMPFLNRRCAAVGVDGVWAIDLSEPPRAVCRGADGSVLYSFACPPRVSGTTYSTMMQDGSILWAVMGPYYGDPPAESRILEIDIAASDVRGNAVINREILVQQGAVAALTRHTEHFALIAQNRLITIDSLGQVLSDSAVPVMWPSSIASDGESIWITHHGPNGLFTDATLLTRFTLE